MSQSHVAAYEAGRRPISADQEKRIALALRRSPSQVLRDHAAEVRSIAAEHGAERVSVFGSVARGEDGFSSDVDLLVKLRPGVGLFDLVTMQDEIEMLLGIPVDVVSEAALKPRDDDIRREAVAL
jgi:predicted nucleotidyltransferase